MLQPHVSFDGGDLDCGNGLLLLIRRHIDPLEPGQVLEVLSSEVSVEEDLPAWCRLTGNPLLSWSRQGQQRSYLLSKGGQRPPETPQLSVLRGTRRPPETPQPLVLRGAQPRLERQAVSWLAQLPAPQEAPPVPLLACFGIGSWPRPRWLLTALHLYLSGRSSRAEFEQVADDAVRLALDDQVRAGVDLVSDGEQRRDSYASFVGSRLDNCQLIPLADLAALVEDPEEFQAELRALDVPAQEVRHPVVLGPLGRSQGLALHEISLPQQMCQLPLKVALPGPYLLTRMMWLDCLNDRYYASREALAEDVVKLLREELFCLLAQGVALVQFDEPVLTEVVMTGPKSKRSFMCGALSEKGESQAELGFAQDLLRAVCAGAPPQRLALHLCRGNWTQDESALLQGSYQPLLGYFQQVPVGTLLLEFATSRAGELEFIRQLPERLRLGIGLVNPKSPQVEDHQGLLTRARQAINWIGVERLLLTPDCGFATFADNPVASQGLAQAKLQALVRVAQELKGG